MNRAERRTKSKISRKEENKFDIKYVKNIDQELDITEHLIKEVNKNIVKVEFPKNVRKECRECIHHLEGFMEIFHIIREVFLKDKKCNSGFVKKCAVNALEIPMYKEKLDKHVENVRKNKGKGIDGELYYFLYHDLSANEIEVRRVLEVLEKAVSVLITSLKANNVTDKTAKSLVVQIIILEKRLHELYILYGYYLEDIGNKLEYQFILQIFDSFNVIIRNLVELFTN